MDYPPKKYKKVERVKVGVEDAKRAVQFGLNKSAFLALWKHWQKIMASRDESKGWRPLKVKQFGPLKDINTNANLVIPRRFNWWTNEGQRSNQTQMWDCRIGAPASL
jgi:hypothetical protein